MRYLRRWQLAFVCLLALLLPPVVPVRSGQARAVTYTVTDLGTLGGSYSEANSIDNCGRVVGESPVMVNGAPHPFFWSNGQITDIGTFGGDIGGAFGINASATAAGNAATPSNNVHAFIWTAASGKTDIGTLPGGVFATALDINDSNQIVGVSDVSTGGSLGDRGFFWQQSTGMQAVPSFAGGNASTAYGINNAGQIVGTAAGSFPGTHAFLLTGGVGGTMTDLGTLGGTISLAYEVNDSGQVVGFSTFPSNSASPPHHAFIWSQGVMHNLNPNGGNSRAFDLNNSGQAVGEFEITPGVHHAFIYTQATDIMSDLNDSIAPGSNWTLQEARSINDRGQIVGLGINPDGATRAFLLTPDNVAPSPCDQPGNIQFSNAAYSVSEAGTKATITVTRTDGYGGAVSVDYATSDGTATAGQDYTAIPSGTLNFAEGETSKTFDVSVTNDAFFEQDETVNLMLSNPQGGATRGTQKTATLTITNDDGVPTISVNDVSVPEGDADKQNMTFTVTLSAASSQNVSVHVATADSTATSDSDYDAITDTNATVNIPAGSTSATFNVAVRGDTLDEADETFLVNLSNPSNATISDDMLGVGTITDNDAEPSLAINEVTLTEGNSGPVDAAFNVTLSAPSGKTVTVNFATADNTATTAGGDYNSASGTLTFNPGQTLKTVKVQVNDDTAFEPDETFFVNLTNPSNASFSDSQGVGTIKDGDVAPTLQFSGANYNVGEDAVPNTATITVTRTGGSNAASVRYATSNGTATAGLDYTAIPNGTLNFDEGETLKTFPVSIINDTLDEADETINLTLSPPTDGAVLGSQTTAVLTIKDDNDPAPSLSIKDATVMEGNGGTTNAEFDVILSAASGQVVTANFSIADGTATAADGDYQPTPTPTPTPLTFAPGETKKTIKVQVNGDTKFENDETFVVKLTGASNASISTNSQGLGTIKDDDSPPSFSINSDLTLAEGNAGTTLFTFTVTKTGLTAFASNVNFATADGTASAASGDYTAINNGLLAFNPDDTSKSITVAVKGDTLDEADETFFVKLLGASNASLSTDHGQVQGTIMDDDGAPSLSISDVTVTEGDAGTTDAVFNVTLLPASGQTVKVNVATANGTATAPGDYQPVSIPTLLTFAPGETAKSVSVKVNGDTANETDETFFVNLSGAINADVPHAQGVGTITNDDTPRLQFSQAVFAADESQHFKVINVTRTGDTSIPVTVDYVTTDGTASQRNDYTFAFGTLRFGAGETSKSFDLLLTDDAFNETDKTINLTLSNPTGGAILGTQSTATASVVANDNPAPASNPIDEAGFFVRMQYHDFLGRRPDDSGFGFWTGGITSCGSNTQCREVKRIETSAAFFLSIEFQNTGYLVERIYKVAYGDADGMSRLTGTPARIPVPIISLSEFLPDSAIIREGVIVGPGNWEQVLDNNKNSFALAFVQRQRFVNAYPTTLSPIAFVEKLNQNTGGALTQSEVDALVAEFGGAANTADTAKRASVLRKVAENSEVDRRERNRAFVLMQFFGYLQRDPDAAPDTDHTGWKFWLDKLDQFGGDFRKAEMVKAFISSDEYRHRFGQ